METKTVQMEFFPDGKVSVTYFLNDKQIGGVKEFASVPKRLEFFLEKFPRETTSPKGKSNE